MSGSGPSEYYSQSAGPSTQATWGNTQAGSGGWHSYNASWSNGSSNSGGGNNLRGNRWRGRSGRGFYQGGRGRGAPHYSYNQPNQFHLNTMWNSCNMNTSIPPPPLPMSMQIPHSGHYHHQPYSKIQQKGDHQKHHMHKQNGNNSKSSASNPDSKENESNLESSGKGAKRRPMSQNYPTRRWNKEDAELALKAEVETTRTLRNQNLIIRFPDPELSRDIVKKYHPGILNVHFQVPSGPRYCFVQLAPNCNSEKIIKFLESIEFGTGRLTVEKKNIKDQENLSAESIDPYTLFIGNLPTNLNISTVKEKFPTASRVDVGFAQKMRYTRYAFIRYDTVEEAIKAYKQTHNLILDSRSIVVRFRRLTPTTDSASEAKSSNPFKADQPPAKKKKDAEDDVKTAPKNEDVEENRDEDDDEEDDDDDDDDEDDEDNGDDGDEKMPTQIQDDDDDDDDDDFKKVERPPDDDDDDVDEIEGDDEWDAEPQLQPQPQIDSNERNSDNLFRDLDARLGDIGESLFKFN